MRFTIWYENGKFEGNGVDDWMRSPNTGVVGILEYFGDSRFRISAGSDWYWIENKDVVHSNTTHDEPGKFVVNPNPNNKTIKTGKWVSDQRMKQVDEEIAEIINNG